MRIIANDEVVFGDRGHWGKMNSYFDLAIVSQYKIGGFPLAILHYIVAEYNRIKYSGASDEIALSLGDIADKANVGIDTAKQAINTLLGNSFIVRERRKGRVKSRYKPNVELINTVLDDYLNYNPRDSAFSMVK